MNYFENSLSNVHPTRRLEPVVGDGFGLISADSKAHHPDPLCLYMWRVIMNLGIARLGVDWVNYVPCEGPKNSTSLRLATPSRLGTKQVLCHPWIIDDTIAPDKPLDSAVLSRLKQFSAMNQLKKMALRVIAERLSEEEIGGLRELFKMIDADDSGSVTFEELKEGLRKVGSELMESEIKDLMEARS
ncbi:hypothetical protein ACLB2K_039689 [Fragaria x ananassa]